jgi:hypothetical protein
VVLECTHCKSGFGMLEVGEEMRDRSGGLLYLFPCRCRVIIDGTIPLPDL